MGTWPQSVLCAAVFIPPQLQSQCAHVACPQTYHMPPAYKNQTSRQAKRVQWAFEKETWLPQPVSISPSEAAWKFVPLLFPFPTPVFAFGISVGLRRRAGRYTVFLQLLAVKQPCCCPSRLSGHCLSSSAQEFNWVSSSWPGSSNEMSAHWVLISL